ncbi:unnamed protein product [Fraxinus pennsylvanica]|uniref:Carbohydrate binding domain-containing protein n=1 Tax=Fraxinus pennsylvanica TaxID=56036 RepID=A0AAD2E5Q2_9LAMI|nr:unnamed protein product [Fraxinus pennsylvanica]
MKHEKPIIHETPQDQQVDIEAQNESGEAKGDNFVDFQRKNRKYLTKVTNKSSNTLKNIKLSISKLYAPLWGLTKSGDTYFFPAWINSLAAGKSEYVYIHLSSPAKLYKTFFSPFEVPSFDYFLICGRSRDFDGIMANKIKDRKKKEVKRRFNTGVFILFLRQSPLHWLQR